MIARVTVQHYKLAYSSELETTETKINMDCSRHLAQENRALASCSMKRSDGTRDMIRILYEFTLYSQPALATRWILQNLEFIVPTARHKPVQITKVCRYELYYT